MKILVHPNLVQLLEIINSSESLYAYLVLEYIDGGPIMKYNSTTKKFLYRLTNTTMGESTARYSIIISFLSFFSFLIFLRRSFIDLLSGLSFMHSHHIAHRLFSWFILSNSSLSHYLLLPFVNIEILNQIIYWLIFMSVLWLIYTHFPPLTQ